VVITYFNYPDIDASAGSAIKAKEFIRAIIISAIAISSGARLNPTASPSPKGQVSKPNLQKYLHEPAPGDELSAPVARDHIVKQQKPICSIIES
jgi:hypothetical protein